MVKVADDLKLVQEIAKRVSEPPSQFVQKEENRPIGVAPKATDVPIIHLRRLFEPDGEEALQLNDALRTWGLFQVVSDDISASFLDEIHCVSKKFFDLPKEEKLKFKTPRDDGEFTLEGYGSDVVQTEDQIRDWNDRVLLLVHPENERKLELWPDNPSSFRSLLHEFSSKSTKIVKDVLRAIAKLLELEDDYFTNQYGEDFISYARFNYYAGFPKCDAVMGMKAHCDDSTLTLLLLDKDVEGLQVLKNGEWLSIPAVTNALLVNLGDQMEVYMNPQCIMLCSKKLKPYVTVTITLAS